MMRAVSRTSLAMRFSFRMLKRRSRALPWIAGSAPRPRASASRSGFASAFTPRPQNARLAPTSPMRSRYGGVGAAGLVGGGCVGGGVVVGGEEPADDGCDDRERGERKAPDGAEVPGGIVRDGAERDREGDAAEPMPHGPHEPRTEERADDGLHA